MRKDLRADSPLIFRPKVVPDLAAMERLQEKREAFSYVPEEGFHRDRVQPRLFPRIPDNSPLWLRA